MSSPALIEKPPIFSFQEILWFLDRNYDDCLFEVGHNEVARLISHGGQQTLISIVERNDQLEVKRLAGDKIPIGDLEDYVVSWFDLGRDIEPFYRLLERSILSYMSKDFNGLRIVGVPDLFEALCWCVIGQQVNLTFAYKIKRRFVEVYGSQLDYQDKSFYTFPSPKALEGVSMENLKDMQFSRQKADYILGLAKTFRETENLQRTIGQLEKEDQLKELLKLRGVGEWTANYVMMKTYGQVDSIPHGDSGLFKALENHKVIEDRKDRNSIDKFFKQFPGWGSYVTIYLWRSLNSPPKG